MRFTPLLKYIARGLKAVYYSQNRLQYVETQLKDFRGIGEKDHD